MAALASQLCQTMQHGQNPGPCPHHIRCIFSNPFLRCKFPGKDYASTVCGMLWFSALQEKATLPVTYLTVNNLY